jgi:hypothetical protein
MRWHAPSANVTVFMDGGVLNLHFSSAFYCGVEDAILTALHSVGLLNGPHSSLRGSGCLQMCSSDSVLAMTSTTVDR